jgi:hypothetical protein
MATVQFAETNFVIQVAETELTWVVSWGLARFEWFNFQLAPDSGAFEDDVLAPTTMEITRQWVTVAELYPWEVRAWFTVRNASAPGTECVLSFTGMRSHG